MGSFVRDGRHILLVVNVGKEPYHGKIAVGAAGGWRLLDPADGSIREAEKAGDGHVKLLLAPRQAVLLVQGP